MGELYINTAQLDDLYKSLKNGMPLQIALNYAGISLSVYKYVLALASVSYSEKESIINKELSGVMEEDLPVFSSKNLSSFEVCKWITPKPKYLKKYHYDSQFQKLCDQAYGVITKINKCATENILYHLQKINMNGARTKQGKVVATASMWYLERALPTFFGKRDNIEENNNTEVRPVEITFVDPDSEESRKRVNEMQESIDNSIPDSNIA